MAEKKSYDPLHLQKKNPVPIFDDHIRFDEEPHLYYFNGKPCGCSVTSLFKPYFKQFDPESAYAMMIAGKGWNERHKYWGKTKAEIFEEWTSSHAADFGTAMHNCIEKFYNIPELYSITDRIPTEAELLEYYEFNEVSCPEFKQFLDFHRNVACRKEWLPYRTELRVYDEAADVAGSIDMMYIDKQGNLHIVDWKRSKEIKTSSWDFENRRPAFGTGPCVGLPDCNLTLYTLQVNTYAEILRRAFADIGGIKLGSMMLAVFHPNYTKEYVDQQLATMSKRKRKIPDFPIGYQAYLAQDYANVVRRRLEIAVQSQIAAKTE